jgi:hypothetical protein
MTGPNPSLPRTLDFGNGNSVLQFADSHSEDWSTDILTVTNFTPGKDKLRFGVDSNGLTAAQLGQIAFADYANAPGVIDASGYVLPNLPKFIGARLIGPPAQIEMTWTAAANRTYLLQWRDDFSSGWNVKGEYGSASGTISIDDNVSNTARFYEVVLLTQ